MSSNPRRLSPASAPDKAVYDLKPFHVRLREMLAQKGWSQSDLARAVWGSTQDAKGNSVARNRDRVSQYCSGKGVPEPENLKKIADALGVTVAQLAPDIVSAGVEAEEPSFALHAVQGRPNMVVLRVNTLTTAELAASIIGQLARTDAAH